MSLQMSQSLPLSDLTLVKYSHTQFSHASKTIAIMLRPLLLKIKKETKQTQIIISLLYVTNIFTSFLRYLICFWFFVGHKFESVRIMQN